MTTKREGNTVTVTVSQDEGARLLDQQEVREAILPEIALDEELDGFTVKRLVAPLVFTVELDVWQESEPSIKEVYLKENKVPFV